MIVEKNGSYFLLCPDCGKERSYETANAAIREFRKKSVCKRCVHKGNRCYAFGVAKPTDVKEKIRKSKTGYKHSSEHIRNQSLAQKKRYSNPQEIITTSYATKLAMHRPEIRKKHLTALHQSQWIHVRTDVGQVEMIKKWNRLGFQFQPNFQVCTDVDLFYVDGYDPHHNVVLEYDGKYHLKYYQKEKDKLRQQKIIDILKPKKFWRYNSITKTFTNVVGD